MRHRAHRSVGAAAAAAVVTMALVVGALSFGPLVRARVQSEAARRRLTVRVDAVRMAWGGVRLVNVLAAFEGVDGVRIHVDDAFIAFGWNLRVDQIDLSGGLVAVSGPPTRINAELTAWRARVAGASSSGLRRSSTGVRVHDIGFRWFDEQSVEPRLDVRGVGGVWEKGAFRLTAKGGEGRAGAWAVSFSNALVAWGAAGQVERARAESLVARWGLPSSTAATRASDPAGHRPTEDAAGSDSSPTPGADAGLLPLPDLAALRSRITLFARLLSDRILPGADVGADSLRWSITRPNDPLPLTIGPGMTSIERSSQGIELTFSTAPSVAGTPVSVRATLPAGQGDATVTFDGGPISLAQLGVDEGAAGLAGVRKAMLTGRARAALTSDATALTFDGDIGVQRLSLQNARLAVDPIGAVDVRFRGRGTISPGKLRLDDFGATVGALTFSLAGHLEQEVDHVAGDFHAEMPMARCQALLESLPPGLLPTLDGAKMRGTLQARARVYFDSRALDDLALEYDLQDQCRLADVPHWLAHSRFDRAFSHTIYLPDGTTGEQTTGPGTANWTPLDEISPYMQVAVLTTEDGAFPHHHGFNRAAIRASVIANLKARRFVRGASTITMQLAKNLFLSRDKTLSRKLEEVILTEYLEQTFSKQELMELYLNVIEFGPAVYGITGAAEYYFGRSPAELNLAECMFLSSVLPSPRRHGAMRDNGTVSESWMRVLHTLMEAAHRSGRLSDAELALGRDEPVVFWDGNVRPPPRPPVQLRAQADDETEDSALTTPASP